MIFHASLPADRPENTARILADMLGGVATPFPPGPDSWMAWSGDGLTELELTPRGRDAFPGTTDMEWRPTARSARSSDWHIAMGTAVAAEEVLRLAAEAGWPARLCQRGPFFRCIELWVEGAALIELLDPSMQHEYRATMTPENWRATFSVDAVA